MELIVAGRNVSIPDRFRDYVEEKIDKVDMLSDKAQYLEVKVTSVDHAQRADTAITVELTVKCKGPVVRAEAEAADKFAAFDIAYGKLVERLRRARDKRKVHHGRHTPMAVSMATAGLGDGLSLADSDQRRGDFPDDAASTDEGIDSPVLIRRKTFQAAPMSVDDAVDNMELVGHDFYLFIDQDSGETSVVYRRKGWTYGVLSLAETLDGEGSETKELPYRASAPEPERANAS